MSTLRLRVEQTAPLLARPAENLSRIAEAQRAAAEDGVELLVTPELSLTGYDLRDRVHEVAVPLAGDTFQALSAGPDVVLGMVERGAGSVPYNTAVHLRGGKALHRHRKVYLPTYGMFEEGRYFGAGDRVRAYDAGNGWRMGLLVCEDLWHPALTYLLAADGADLLVVQSAAAGRGAWEGGKGGARFASRAGWESLAVAAATAYGVYVVLCNRAGVEGPAVFAGDSFVVAPDGRVVSRADDLAEDRITVDLSLEEVARARRPYAHARDEDAHLVARELARILAEAR